MNNLFLFLEKKIQINFFYKLNIKIIMNNTFLKTIKIIITFALFVISINDRNNLYKIIIVNEFNIIQNSFFILIINIISKSISLKFLL